MGLNPERRVPDALLKHKFNLFILMIKMKITYIFSCLNLLYWWKRKSLENNVDENM